MYCRTAPRSGPVRGNSFEARVLHRVDPALDVVQQAVARPLVHRADQLALGGERDLDRVVEPAAAEPLDLAAVGPAPPDPGGQSFEVFPSRVRTL